MSQRITFSTKGYYIQPVRGLVAEKMVVVLCLITAMLAALRLDTWQATGSGFGGDSMAGLHSLGVLLDMAFAIALAFGRLVVARLRGLAFRTSTVAKVSRMAAFFSLLALCVYSFASLALIVPVKSTSFVSGKVVKLFSFFACAAAFLYNCLRHDFLLIRKLCLEPSTRPILVGGSSHYRGCAGAVKWL